MKLRIQGHDVQVEQGFPAGSGIRDYVISGPFVNTRGFYYLGSDSSEAAIEAYMRALVAKELGRIPAAASFIAANPPGPNPAPSAPAPDARSTPGSAPARDEHGGRVYGYKGDLVPVPGRRPPPPGAHPSWYMHPSWLRNR